MCIRDRPYTIRVFVAEQRVVVYGTTASGTEVPIRKMVTSTGVKGYSTPLTGENHHYYLGGGVLWICLLYTSMATQIEVDKAMEYLLKRLRESGMAERTLRCV